MEGVWLHENDAVLPLTLTVTESRRASSTMVAVVLLLAAHSSALVVAPPANVFVFGPGSLEVQLITAKLGARTGYGVSVLQPKAWAAQCKATRLMYGSDEAELDSNLRLVAANSEIGGALAKADAAVLVAEAGGSTGAATTIRNAPALRRLVLLSAVGGSKGIGGDQVLGEGKKIQECEEEVKALAASAGVELSIVRAGILKGGGPAGGGREGYAGPSDFGLDAAYYATLTSGGYETVRRRCTMAYDAVTLGASVSPGDAIEPRNAVARALAKGSTEACADEASRINCAGALLACLRQPRPLELSLSSQEGTVPPTDEEWDRMLRELP